MQTPNTQEAAWEREYRNPQMLKRNNVPHADVQRFYKWLKKKQRKAGGEPGVYEWKVLDLGSGTGRNAFYFAELGAHVIGYEVSDTALQMASKFAQHAEEDITYEKRDIGQPYPLTNNSIDLVLDITSSNSLNAEGRETYLKEVFRVLKPGGLFIVRALAKDGDRNAQKLVTTFAGSEPDTYVHPDLGIMEKVFTRETFTETYSAFTVLELERSQRYPTVADRTYKRNYWVGYLQKPAQNT